MATSPPLIKPAKSGPPGIEFWGKTYSFLQIIPHPEWGIAERVSHAGAGGSTWGQQGGGVEAQCSPLHPSLG